MLSRQPGRRQWQTPDKGDTVSSRLRQRTDGSANFLLDAAESLSIRTRNGGGSDSDFGAAATSRTTKYGKKRFTLQGLKKQQKSLKHVKGQTELLAQQLSLQKAQMEHRKEDF